MDHHYGVAVTNKFALFTDDDEDPIEAVLKINAQKDEDKKARAKKTLEEEDKKVDRPAGPQNDEAEPKEVGDKQWQTEKGKGSARNREPRELRENDGDRRPPRRQGPRDFKDGKPARDFKDKPSRDYKDGKAGDENVPPEFREQPQGGFKRREDREGSGFGGERGRGRGRGRGGGRGGRGGDRSSGGGFGPRGDQKREFDRHSGTDRTGIKAIEKKEGHGSHNWGSFRDDIEEQGQVAASEENPDRENQPEKTELNESAEGGNATEEEAQPQQMTLDEWKALQTQSKPKPKFKIRQAGEGVDSAQWKQGVEYQKKQDDHQEHGEHESEHGDQHGRDNKQLLSDIRITFNDNPRRGRGRRGGRGGMERGGGGGRGSRGGRGAARGFGNKKETAPRFDETDFPSLLKTAA